MLVFGVEFSTYLDNAMFLTIPVMNYGFFVSLFPLQPVPSDTWLEHTGITYHYSVINNNYSVVQLLVNFLKQKIVQYYSSKDQT
jgi:hypothetical protein